MAASFREVHIDVTEINFKPLAGIVVERNKSLALPVVTLTKVAADTFIAAAVAMFLLLPAPQLRCGMSLLPRCLLVGLENGVDDWLERIKNGRRRFEPEVALRLRCRQDLADSTPRNDETAGLRP